MKIVHYYRNARAVVKQIKAGEWEVWYNPQSLEHLKARRKGVVLWIGSGGFFCTTMVTHLNDIDAFGLIFRHYVWWGAARKLKRDADRKVKDEKTFVKFY